LVFGSSAEIAENLVLLGGESLLPKDQLEHGAYYTGTCRNASIARWNEKGFFIHWRTKFYDTYPECIGYWVDAKPGEIRFDEFQPFAKLDNPRFTIPLTEEEFNASGGFVYGIPNG
jgi:hypothetical protein